MTDCKIYLENSGHAVYLAGQYLKGTIELHLKEPKKVNGLYFIVYGAATCHWTETRTEDVGFGENRRTQIRTVSFDGKEVYINSITYLIGRAGSSAVEIPSGIHRFELVCLLPPQLPASLEASHGNIRYHVEAVLDVPWRFDKKFTLQFSVGRVDDLNEFPELKIQTSIEEIRNFWSLFSKSDPLTITANVPYAGFIPGQSIPITITCHNKSNVDIKSIHITLKKITRFNSTSPSGTKCDSHDIGSVLGEGIKSGGDKVFQRFITVPQFMQSSNEKWCKVVQIYYQVQISVKVTGMHQNFVLTVPVTIGNIPLTFGGIHAGYGSPSAPSYNELPPSFEEATRLDTNVKDFKNLKNDVDDDWDFA